MTLRCVDTSAWHRSSHPQVAEAWLRAIAADEVGICDQARLEILYSARSAPDYERLVFRLDGLHPLLSIADDYTRALEVQRGLAHVGGLHHRSVKIADLLIGAAAERAEVVMWHYDADFDRIAEVTGHPSEWIAPRGSL